METTIMDDKKQPKERASKYEEKVAVKGTFEDIIKAALSPKKKDNKESDSKK
jgi:hypothetical protein